MRGHAANVLWGDELLKVHAPPEAARLSTPVSAPGRPGPERAHWLHPGWPLSALLLGYPLWWALGLSTFILPIAAVPMAFALLRRRGLRAPSGFGPWLLFLVWVAIGVGVLWADAPGAIPGGGPTRILTWSLRLSYYVSATIALLYVGNLSERELPTRRVMRLLAWMFVVTAMGGILGMLAPHLQWTSLAEVLLPQRIAASIDAVHPGTAQVQNIIGVVEARPKAPFAYTNEWGANLVLLLPFFVVAWLGRDAGWRRYAAPVVLLLATVGLVYSLNRGAWIGVLLALAFLAVRSAAAGKVAALTVLVTAAVVASLAFALSPLGPLVQDRLANPHSNERRGLLATQTVESAAQASPIVGFGSTRPVQGNLSSIAGGASGSCPKCAAPPLGTHGQLWLLVFSQGFVGAALFMWFLARRFLRHWLDPRPEVVACAITMMLFGVFSLYYNLLPFPILTLFVAIALAWRAGPQRGVAEHAAEEVPA